MASSQARESPMGGEGQPSHNSGYMTTARSHLADMSLFIVRESTEKVSPMVKCDGPRGRSHGMRTGCIPHARACARRRRRPRRTGAILGSSWCCVGSFSVIVGGLQMKQVRLVPVEERGAWRFGLKRPALGLYGKYRQRSSETSI